MTGPTRMTAAQYRAMPKPKRAGMTEAQLHRAVASYLNAALPKDAVWTTVGHGGGGKVRGAQLKAMGLRAGWPDVQILWNGEFYGIELKTVKGRSSPEQDACMEAIFEAGGRYETIRSLDELQDWLRMLCMPLRVDLDTPSRKRSRA